MIKVALACTLLLALTYKVSAENINCLSCYEGDKSHISVTIPGMPSTPCNNETLENSKTEQIDNEKKSCAKFDIEVTMGDDTYDVTVRTTIDKDQCETIEKNFDTALSALQGTVEGSLDCYDCDEEKCNFANTIQVSFLMVLAPAIAYLIRS